MAEEKTKRYMEIQMEELKAAHASEVEEEVVSKKSKDKKEQNAKIAKLYEDAAEYEADLEGFENELEVINAHNVKNIATSLSKELPDEERDYEKELKSILEAGWNHLVEVEKTHKREHLELIKETAFSDVVDKLDSAYSDYSGSFENDVKNILVKRLEMLIGIKKEHISQEHEDIKIAGLKPKWVKRAYEQYHGISN